MDCSLYPSLYYVNTVVEKFAEESESDTSFRQNLTGFMKIEVYAGGAEGNSNHLSPTFIF